MSSSTPRMGNLLRIRTGSHQHDEGRTLTNDVTDEVAAPFTAFLKAKVRWCNIYIVVRGGALPQQRKQPNIAKKQS